MQAPTADHTDLIRPAAGVGEQIAFPGSGTPDGPAVAAQVMQHRRDDAAVNVDVIGVGTSVYDSLSFVLGSRVVAMNGSTASRRRDKSGQLSFLNSHADWRWSMREALDPASGRELALPPDPELAADLCAPTWKLGARGVQVESKEDMIRRIGRSPDKGDSCVYACVENTFPGWGVLEYYRLEVEKMRGNRR